MSDNSRVVVFTLDQRRFGVPLHSVERIISVVEVTPLPQTPAVVLGIINFHGRIVPVYNLRALIGLPSRELQISDQFIIAQTPLQTVALLTDEVIGLEDAEAIAVAVPTPDFVDGITANHDKFVFICDLQRFLSGEEQATLNASIKAWDMQNGRKCAG